MDHELSSISKVGRKLEIALIKGIPLRFVYIAHSNSTLTSKKLVDHYFISNYNCN